MGKRRISTLKSGFGTPNLSEQSSALRCFQKTMALGLTAAVLGLGLAGYSAYADTNGSAQQRVLSNVDAGSVSLSTSGDVGINVIPTSGGSLGVGKGTVTVTSSSGYQLYISGTQSGSNGYLPLNYNGNADATSKIAGMAVNTPTPFSSAYANSWGYAVAGNGSTGNFSTAATYNSAVGNNITDSTTLNNLKWQGVNNTYKQIKSTTSPTDKTTDVYFGVYVNTEKMAGNYQNSVVYTAFVEGADKLEVYPNQINSGDTITVTAEYKSGTIPVTNANQISISLLDGETSIGTCDNVTITSNGSSNLLAFTCRANLNSSAKSLTPYDVAVNLSIPGRSDTLSFKANDVLSKNPTTLSYTMQNMTASNCSALTTGEPYGIKDSRDNKWYLISKLADNNCWMIQNLALEGGKTITSSDSNVNANYPLPASSTSGFSSNTGQYMYNGSHKDNTFDNTSDNTGAYYSWLTATANSGAGISTDYSNASYSICPKGWRLPKIYNGNSTKMEMGTIFSTTYYTGFTNFNNSWHGALVGNYSYSSLSGSGSYGYWWSRTVYSSGRAYYLYINSSSADTSSNDKGHGYSVRCVFGS